MKLMIRKIDPDRPEMETIALAVKTLNDGGMVAAPTETKYGILARADRKQVVDRLYDLKDRNRTNPIAIFLESSDQIRNYGMESDLSRRIAAKFLPGPLTLVMTACRGCFPHLLRDAKIGIRVSSSPVIGAIMEKVSFPVTATSANLSGRPDPSTIEGIADIFGDKIDLYLDAGLLNNPGSTVVDCTGDAFKILRQGVITSGDIRRALKIN